MMHTFPLGKKKKKTDESFYELAKPRLNVARGTRAGSPVFFERRLISIYIKSRELVYGLGALPVHRLSTLE